jgi:hypothetical protein
MTDRVDIQGLQVERGLYDFIQNEAMPGTGVASNTFWVGFAALIGSLTARNRSLLKKRADLQARIDAWHRENGACECRQCALGQPLRCALRHRRDGRPAPRWRVQRGPGRPGGELGRAVPR